jgi:hypothetical protein
MATEKKHAAWLEKDDQRSLFHGDDVADALANGWERAEGVQGTGEPWNPPVVEGEDYPLDQLADAIKASNALRDEKAAKKTRAEAKK